jgi:hypothetical protein
MRPEAILFPTRYPHWFLLYSIQDAAQHARTPASETEISGVPATYRTAKSHVEAPFGNVSPRAPHAYRLGRLVREHESMRL